MLACQNVGFVNTLSQSTTRKMGEDYDVMLNGDEDNMALNFDHQSTEYTSIVLLKVLLRPHQHPSIRPAEIMRCAVDSLIDRHGTDFNSMMSTLNLNFGDLCEASKAFQTVVDQIFVDGQYNWGRLVTVYAFATVLFRRCVTDRQLSDEQQELMTSHMGNHIARRLNRWIEENGGWDEFERFFSKPEKSLWRTLLATTVVGAMAALIITR